MTHCDNCGQIARYATDDGGALCHECREGGQDAQNDEQHTLADHGGNGQATLGGY